MLYIKWGLRLRSVGISMKQVLRTISGLIAGVIVSACAMSAAFADEEAVALLKRVDELYRANTSEASIRMQIVTPNWERTMEMH